MPAVRASSRRPASVSTMPRPLRVNSSARSSCSSSLIWRLSAGCATRRVSEAFLRLSAACAILEEIQRAGCNGGGCHAQMYTMGTLLRHGNDEQKAKWLPRIASGELRLQAFGVTEPTSGTDTSSLKTFAKRDGNK